MAPGTILLWLACANAILSVVLLRVAWALKKRSAPLNGAGWLLFALAAVLGWAGAGAWGVAVAGLAGMSAACAVLAYAAATAPRGKGAASNRRVKMLPEAGEQRMIGRRVVTFLLTVPLAMLVSIGLGVALRGLTALLGWSEANANTIGLFIVPVAWAVIAHVLLIQQRRRTQLAILLAGALPLVPVVLTGAMA